MNTTDSLIRYWQSPHLPGVELSHSHHRAFSYGRHVHLDYHIGLVQRGGQKFIHKGNSHHLVRGVLSTVNPDEVHDGLSLLPEGYEVRVVAIDPQQLALWLPEQPEPFFDKGLQSRPDLYQGFAQLHGYLDNPKADGLLIESQLLALLGDLLHLAPEVHQLADPQLRFLRDYLMAALDEPHSLEELAVQEAQRHDPLRLAETAAAGAGQAAASERDGGERGGAGGRFLRSESLPPRFSPGIRSDARRISCPDAIFYKPRPPLIRHAGSPSLKRELLC